MISHSVDVATRVLDIAALLIGGIMTSFLLELVYPAIFGVLKSDLALEGNSESGKRVETLEPVCT